MNGSTVLPWPTHHAHTHERIFIWRAVPFNKESEGWRKLNSLVHSDLECRHSDEGILRVLRIYDRLVTEHSIAGLHFKRKLLLESMTFHYIRQNISTDSNVCNGWWNLNVSSFYVKFEIETYVWGHSDCKAMGLSVVLVMVSEKYFPNNNRMPEVVREKVIYMKWKKIGELKRRKI